MPPESLPEFKGKLAPASWSGIKLNPMLEEHLQAAALPSCKGCSGRGWFGSKPVVQICHCILRRPACGI